MIIVCKAILIAATICYHVALSLVRQNRIDRNALLYVKEYAPSFSHNSKKEKRVKCVKGINGGKKKWNAPLRMTNEKESDKTGKSSTPVESVKFYGFSRIYEHFKLNKNESGVGRGDSHQSSEAVSSSTANNIADNIADNITDNVADSGTGEAPQPSSDLVKEQSNNLLVKDDPNRIQRMKFEETQDYSSIFKEREKKAHIKTYVANIFQKLPKFKDNIKVIKDALLYLKFIEKGNLYLIKNVDRRTVNAEPYVDLDKEGGSKNASSKRGTKKGTKKDKIKLELTSIYNNINKEKHTKKRICKECCIKVDLYTKMLSRPLNNIYNVHKNLKKYLHPFQYSLYENAITNFYKEGEAPNSLSDVLNNILQVRKLITLTGKTYAGQMKYLKTCREIFSKLNEAIVDLNIILQSGRKWLDVYNSYIKRVRKIKYIDITKPAISIIGCTNVGKSSVLNSITNAKSKVADYNFTTKEFNLGHYSFTNQNDVFTTQIMDLPGLINRPEEKRNLMEKLSLSSLKNIPSAVDIRYYLRGLFPFRPWIDVVTKADLTTWDEINLPKDIKENALFISTEDTNSLLPLRQRINEVTFKLTDFLAKHTMEP
ncbi:GTP-binding protein [Plasmodium cynomolgi strain B]|uniref:GTP-binding protein n=1 Tax=Plasmodium cynomolgi (strain B) TaxID=1120755 RepID=K6UT67_PLACD|nr:GTP-binding protein [Plasmodium cynomolgi strain B]GAB65260.1 GTP-binding protein [Plasmodium cynomolgi strain B]